MLLGKDRVRVAAHPSADFAFVVALVVIADAIEQ